MDKFVNLPSYILGILLYLVMSLKCLELLKSIGGRRYQQLFLVN